eukprot:TRINITY_DN55639_c0_g1_i1.p1 TRINITY_DN55639_c0_g1~~TRINITY_DN55639_c0_g1_i1.p1  ORF type:complete len:903 (+),score=153.36 TRINITY_DN55639_c0_g1_i1:123-2711(+)
MLAIGIDSENPRFSALLSSEAKAGSQQNPAERTTTLLGCVEIVVSTVKQVLRKDVNVGDSFVEVGVDSMTSLSLHSKLVSACGGLELSTNVFYEEPTVLELATLIRKKAANVGSADMAERADAAAESADVSDDLESMLEDADARRSYNLGLARDALKRGAAEEACERCARAADGANGNALVAALALRADALQCLGNRVAAGVALTETLSAREAFSGRGHPDTAVAMARRCLWLGGDVAFAGDNSALCQVQDAPATETTPGSVRGEAQVADEVSAFRQQVGSARRVFFEEIQKPSEAHLDQNQVQLVSPASMIPMEPSGPPLLSLKRLYLDAQGLVNLPAEVVILPALECLRLRRNALHCLPSDLGKMVQMRELLLSNNMLTDLPLAVASMSRLQVLGLEGNLFAKLPEAVYSLHRLLHLGLDEQRCQLQGLATRPLSAGVLNVIRGRGSGASFPELVASSTGPPNLNTIFWANNGLKTVPSFLPRFSVSLRLLDFAHNGIRDLGLELFELANLRDLSLAGNELVMLPATIARLQNLQQLWLHGNSLEELPEELGELRNLAILELHHNRLVKLPQSIARLHKLNWLFAHGNRLTDGEALLDALCQLPRLKICGLGANCLQLAGIDLGGMRPSFGLGWNEGLSAQDGVMTETLTTCDLYWDPLHPGEVQDVLVVTFSSQGAPVAMGLTEVRALRDSLLRVDALYVCDPANAWFLQDPGFRWVGLAYFEAKIKEITSKYRRVFMWGGSMGGSAALLFSHLADCAHAFSPQVDLAITWPSFATAEVREGFRKQLQESVVRCRGPVVVHVGEENHTDVRHASLLPPSVRVHYHDTANHNTMKHVKLRDKLLPLLKFEVSRLLVGDPC